LEKNPDLKNPPSPGWGMAGPGFGEPRKGVG